MKSMLSASDISTHSMKDILQAVSMHMHVDIRYVRVRQFDPPHPSIQVQVSGSEHSLLVPHGVLQIAIGKCEIIILIIIM